MTPEQLRVMAAGGAVVLPDGKGTRWSGRDGKEERPAEMAAARALLEGDQQGFGDISRTAISTHKDWSGGTLAKLAPLAAAFIPGVGPLAATAIGAGIGGAEAATGLDNRSIGEGVVRGGAMGGIGKVARNFMTSGSGPITAATPDVANASVSNVGSSFLSRAPSAIGKFLTNPKNTPLVLGIAGQAGNIYGANIEGDVMDRQLALNEEQQRQQNDLTRRRLSPRPRFADWQAAQSVPGSAAPSY